jgi:hypothetical protein
MRIAQHLALGTARAAIRLEANLIRIMFGWVMVLSVAAGLRLAFPVRPIMRLPDYLAAGLPYVLIIATPIVAIALALRWFPQGAALSQPRLRLARVGRWCDVDAATAQSDPLFGVGGVMFSLLVGTLLNIPMRTLEFMSAVPVAGPGAPLWYGVLFRALLANVVMLSALYAVAFVAALRAVPLFPRLMAAIWSVDIAMQFIVAYAVTSTAGLPAAVGRSLFTLLDGNVKTAVISAALWCPYLLLSPRINLTYRLRVRL